MLRTLGNCKFLWDFIGKLLVSGVTNQHPIFLQAGFPTNSVNALKGVGLLVVTI